MVTCMYVDVSHHDWNRRGGPLDWGAIGMAVGQSDVMIARASYGDPYVFSPATLHFAEMQKDAKAAGYSCRGGYHNLIRGDRASINRQVDLLRRELDAQSCVWAMCDVEPYSELRANGLWPRWSDVLRFRDRWLAVEQRTVAWYASEWVWRDWLGMPDLRELPGPLVNAHYASASGTPQQIYAACGANGAAGWAPFGGRTPEGLQYTSTANVAGASTATDINACRCTTEQLVAVLTGEPVLTVDDKILIKAAVTEALATAPSDWASNGIGTAAGAAGWRPPSMRALAEYTWWGGREMTQRADAQAAEDRTRDAATLAAIEALASAGGVDAAPILTAIREEAAASRTEVERLTAIIASLQAQLADRDARLAAALVPPGA